MTICRTTRITVALIALSLASTTMARVDVRGHDLPSHFAVRNFYGVLFELYRADEEGEYEPFLAHYLGVEDALDIRIVTRHMLLAISLEQEILDERGTNPEAEETKRARHRFRIDQARRLGEIYWPMLDALRAEGVDIGRFQTYLDQEITPNQSTSVERLSDLDADFAAEAAFIDAKDGAP